MKNHQKRAVSLAGMLFLSALLALWSVDVTINLGLGERLFHESETFAGALDFLGLLQAEAPIALFSTLGILILLIPLSLFRKGGNPFRAAV
ncbi:MAG: hypothetical protein V3T95_05560, partial [Acidobacteriota bacterium]